MNLKSLTNKAKNLLSFKSSRPTEQKSSGWSDYNLGSSCSNQSIISILSNSGEYNSLSARFLWAWYRSVKPMRHAVEGIVSPSFASIKPNIYDSKENRFLNSDETVDLSNLLDLFKNPNPRQSGLKFRETFAPSYFVTGNLYFVVDIGVVSNQPVYITYTPPQDVSPVKGSSGFVESYTVTSNTLIQTFYLEEDDDGNISYMNRDRDRELLHIANFNPCSDPIDGLSPLSSTLAEVEQYWQGNTHNNAFIAKGARPSGMLMIHPDVDLSADQEDRLRDLVEKSTYGENTGKVLVAQGGTSYQELSVNNKDMDYINLMERAKVEIYTTLNVPLPLIRDKAMTLNNYSEAKYMLYDFSIFPFADMIYDELNIQLSKYYDTEEGRYVLSYNKDDVDATQIRRNLEVDRLGKSGAITLNEHRDLLGYDARPEGDVIYQPLNLVPAGASTEIIEENNSESKGIKRSKEIFIEKLKETKQFSEEEIQKRADELYG